MRTYCYECDMDNDIELLEKEVTTIIDNIDITYSAKIATCKKCGNEVYIAEISDQNLKIANDKYREKVELIKVSEIEEIISIYEIGKKPLSALLGWGETTIIRYLNGFTPRKIYSDQLKELKEPHKMLLLFEKNKKNISEVTQKKLFNRINQLIDGVDGKKDNSAVNVAKYFLSVIDVEAEEVITPLKLQKMMYYAQGWLLALNNEVFFDEEFQAWVHGPVIPELYYQYKEYGFNTIPKVEKFDSTVYNVAQLSVLDMVKFAYGRYDGKYLEELTHGESPWKEARGKCKANEICTRIISRDAMKRYFGELKVKYNIQNKHDLKKYIANL